MNEHLRFDPHGYVDMEQFASEDPDSVVDPATAEALSAMLAEAPVPTPSPVQFDGWIAQAVAAGTEADTSALVPDGADEPPPPAATTTDEVLDVDEGSLGWEFEPAAGDDVGSADGADPAEPSE